MNNELDDWQSQIMPTDEGLVNCPYCPNQGWYEVIDEQASMRYGYGIPMQEPCEFCHTNPRSVFNGGGNNE